jgi:hypothetical protein
VLRNPSICSACRQRPVAIRMLKPVKTTAAMLANERWCKLFEVWAEPTFTFHDRQLGGRLNGMSCNTHLLLTFSPR